MWRNALVSAFGVLLFTNILVAANAEDIEKLSSGCSNGDHKACEELRDAIGGLTDQALLAKIAIENKNLSIRWAAVKKLTDQELLAKIAIEDKESIIRKAAVEQLSDQTLLAKIAFEDWDVLRAAVEQPTDQSLRSQIFFDDLDISEAAFKKMTDQTLLAKIAVEGKNPRFREDAIKKLTDQALLAEIAVEDKDPSFREDAVRRLTDQDELAKIAVESKDPIIRSIAIASIDQSKTALKRLADLSNGIPPFNTGKSIARIKLAIQERSIQNRFPGVVFAARISSTYRSYGYGKGAATISGEQVSFVLSQAGKTLASRDWNTIFPGAITSRNIGFIYAEVRGEELLVELLRNPKFMQDDLAELVSSEISELRLAAKRRLAEIQNNPK